MCGRTTMAKKVVPYKFRVTTSHMSMLNGRHNIRPLSIHAYYIMCTRTFLCGLHAYEKVAFVHFEPTDKCEFAFVSGCYSIMTIRK